MYKATVGTDALSVRGATEVVCKLYQNFIARSINGLLTIENLLYIRVFAFICRCFIRNYVTIFQKHYLQVYEFNNCSRPILSGIIKIIFYIVKKLLYFFLGISITVEFGNQNR